MNKKTNCCFLLPLAFNLHGKLICLKNDIIKTNPLLKNIQQLQCIAKTNKEAVDSDFYIIFHTEKMLVNTVFCLANFLSLSPSHSSPSHSQAL